MRIILKPLNIRGSFAVKYIYLLLMNPFDIIAMPKNPQLLRKSHLHFRIKLYEYQNYWPQLYMWPKQVMITHLCNMENAVIAFIVLFLKKYTKKLLLEPVL